MPASKRPKREHDSTESDSDSAEADDGQDDDEDEEDDDSEPEPSLAAAQISFGALAKAQASLPSTNKKKKGSRQAKASSDDDQNSSDDSDGAGRRTKEDPSKARRPPIPSRAHKHAPTEQSSKRAVTRKREVVPQTVVKARDPRFDPTAGAVDSDKFRRAYGFLDAYRDDELAAMKRTLRDATAAAKPGATKRNKKLKDAPVLSEHEREKLKREIASIESRKAAQAAKDRHRELLDQHRKQEKELVKQGKTPFYLKKAEQKKQVLVDRFAGMKKGQVDKAIERKRKKVVAKERRDMPWARRSAMEG
ncbi:uncharacterized protein B0I36DRAFT_241102 [Microdochium trichocladiopsis]|uniref:rRNA biogenesis protein RRP36 n=1 Tax=Microdochium trichocladiopsis TaxID=1682393 RepID=A0A9P8Y8A5_9PEZI|nr:uncharacterized protein B0I36DRAFT_241102 [Microdochium trichocladiopsis]KAH7032957.1 hypothetical protein B0I36DRAFT_241102 [Microdochium trichocladiopsis]